MVKQSLGVGWCGWCHRGSRVGDCQGSALNVLEVVVLCHGCLVGFGHGAGAEVVVWCHGSFVGFGHGAGAL